MPVDRWQRAGIRKSKSGSVAREFRGAHSTAQGREQHNPSRGKGPCFSQRGSTQLGKFYCLMATNETEQVQQLQRTLYRTAKQSKAVKFYSLYDKVWRNDVLWEAWRQVKANQGAPGVDKETIEGIVARGEEEKMLSRLQQQLRDKSYRFQPVRRVDIPKPKGGTRPLGIATVQDRVVQTAMKLVLEPIWLC